MAANLTTLSKQTEGLADAVEDLTIVIKQLFAEVNKKSNKVDVLNLAEETRRKRLNFIWLMITAIIISFAISIGIGYLYVKDSFNERVQSSREGCERTNARTITTADSFLNVALSTGAKRNDPNPTIRAVFKSADDLRNSVIDCSIAYPTR